MTWLTISGCSIPGSAGITANLWAESRLIPSVVGKSGAGLPQFAGPRRIRMLSALGSAWTDGYRQLAYIKREASELGVWSVVCQATDAARAARRWLCDYERPRNSKRLCGHGAPSAGTGYRERLAKIIERDNR